MITMNRRSFLQDVASSALLAAASGCFGGAVAPRPAKRPNIVLVMTDDQGWGDTGYNGHPVLQTPTLDAIAQTGLRFERFYSAAPVCSPTRGSCLTGRHPFRYGIFGANSGDGEDPSRFPLPPQEVTLAEILAAEGYATGHFGKWHLGDFGGPMRSSPADQGFQESLSTVRKVATLDPSGYFLNGEPYTEPLEGDDSAVIMDRAIPFIRSAAAKDQPFFTVIWFHSPHNPVIAAPEYRARYASYPEREQHFWGVITAADAQLGRLRDELRALNVAEDTMLWFCSDNGPALSEEFGAGTTGGLRGNKGTLYEGGVRVPGLLEWPSKISEARTIGMPCSTSDYLPTILDVLDLELPDARPVDGVSLAPLLGGAYQERKKPIGFEHHDKAALIEGRYKLLAAVDGENLASPELYDLVTDPAESRNLAGSESDRTSSMLESLRAWRASCTQSRDGADYS
jgi:arylsulfatase A-like enzyme